MRSHYRHNHTIKALVFFNLFNKMVLNAISIVSFSVLIEGAPTPPFKNHKDLDKGTPCPLYYLMVMDVLSRIIDREIRAKRIDTQQVNGTTSISHLMYADDVLLFAKANKKSLASIKSILAEDTQYTGLEINTSKSSVTFPKICEG